jgi:hypothetical protein
MGAKENVNEFEKQLRAEIERIKEGILEEVEFSVEAIQEEVVRRNRIRTGRSKAHWRVSQGFPIFKVDQDILDDDENTWITADQALTRAKESLSNIEYSMNMADVYIANGVYDDGGRFYILKLENMDRMAEGTVQWAPTFLPVVITGALERG